MGGDAAGFAEQESGGVFRLLVASVEDYAIFLLDPDGYVRSWNAGARRIKGYEASEIVGQHFSRFYTPEDAAAGRPLTLLSAAVAAGHVEDEGWRVRKDGSHFWASVVLTALRDDNGRLVGIAKVTRDLTERRLAEEERARLLAEERAARAAAAAAEEALRARDTFLAIAAHELKTPVTALRGIAQLLLRRQARGRLDPADLVVRLRRIEEATARLATLVEELLDVARLRGGQLPLTSAPLDLVALTADAVARAREGDEGTDRVALSTEMGLAPIVGDAGRLEQVLTNLLDNALKYSSAGDPVAVVVRAAGDGVQVSISDTGIGLPPGAAEAIFMPFGRAANAAASGVPGLGLGLYICRTIAARHGGRLWAESAGEGQGATFHLWLPTGAPPACEER